MLSTQLIIMNYPVPPPTQHLSFFRNLTLLIPKYLHVVHIDRISLITYLNFRCSFVFPCCFEDIYSLVIPNPLLLNISIQVLHTVLYTFSTNKENLSNNEEFLGFVIISFILMTSMFDPEVKLLGVIRCLSFLGIKGLKM